MTSPLKDKEQILVVLMDPVDLRSVFDEWPDRTGLAVCMLFSGEYLTLVYRQEELGGLANRIADNMSVPESGVCFFPAQPGHQSRRMLFSDERNLLALIADEPGLASDAMDYSSNFDFAVEEGLNPAEFLHGSVGVAEQTDDNLSRETETVDRLRPDLPSLRMEELGPVSSAPSECEVVPDDIRADLPRFLVKKSRPNPGPRFRAAWEIRDHDPGLDKYTLNPERDGWITIDGGRPFGSEVCVREPSSVFFRDDGKVLALGLDPPWPSGGQLPGRIRIDVKCLPRFLRLHLGKCAGQTGLESDGTFLLLKLSEPQNSHDAAELVQAASRDNWSGPLIAAPKAHTEVVGKLVNKHRDSERTIRKAALASLLVLFGSGILFGPLFQTSSVNAETKVDWLQYQKPAVRDVSGGPSGQ